MVLDRLHAGDESELMNLLRCPFGYADHAVTWRCYAVWIIAWLAGKEWTPFWFWKAALCPLMICLEKPLETSRQ